MKTLVILRHAATRKDRSAQATSSHVSREGVQSARALGARLGEFDYVAVGGLPRHAETALALGHAFDEQISWPSGYVPGVVDHHDQWHWQLPFVTYAALLRRHDALADVAARHLWHWRRIVDLVSEGGQGLIVSSGGSIEPPLVLAIPDAQYAQWGSAFHQLEGARIAWDGRRFHLDALLRRGAGQVPLLGIERPAAHAPFPPPFGNGQTRQTGSTTAPGDNPIPAVLEPDRSPIAQWWGSLPPATRDWLIEHNGKHLPAAVVDEIASAVGGRFDPDWWAGGNDEHATQFTDAACDWIDERANGEHTEPRR